MKLPAQWQIPGVCVLGLLCGLGAKRLTSGPQHTAPTRMEAPASTSAGTSAKSGQSRDGRTGIQVAKSTLRSADTLGSVIELGADISYQRLSLWLLDANKDDIAAYWSQYRERENQERDVTDLIMISWTRVDPVGAVTAEKGTRYENYAWWAWASHNPRAALDAVQSMSPDFTPNVAWGIGEFHPAWLREHFDEMPPEGRANALMGLAKWGETDDPEATLDFLMKNGWDPPAEMLGHMVRQDPWAAIEWIEKHANTLKSRYRWGRDPMDSLYKLLGESHPEVLEQLAAKTPSGETKRNMESILFSHLLQEDLEAAVRQAKTTEAPKIAIERLSLVGLRLLRENPDRAFEIAKQLFSDHPNALNNRSHVFFPHGSSSRGGDGGGSLQLLQALVAEDPVRAMTTFAAGPYEPANALSYTANTVSSIWAERDLEGYAQWVVDRDDPDIQKRAAPAIVGILTQQQRYEEALEWSMGTVEDHAHYPLGPLIQQWSLLDPNAASQWIEQADIPEERKPTYRKYAVPSQ